MKGFLVSLALVVVLAAVACGGTSSGSGVSVNGTFGGQPVVSEDGLAATGTTANNLGNVAYLAEFIANFAGACSYAQQNLNKANATVLALLITTEGAQRVTAIGAGKYSITNGAPAADTNNNHLTVSAVFNALDASCRGTIADTASSASGGAITIDAVTASSVSGSFDLTFPNGDRLSGTFDSPVCPYNPLKQPQPAAATICQ